MFSEASFSPTRLFAVHTCFSVARTPASNSCTSTLLTILVIISLLLSIFAFQSHFGWRSKISAHPRSL